MTVLKTCAKCGLSKPFDPSAKYKSKASGFQGAACWDCWLAASRAAHAKRYQVPENREKAITAARARYATPAGLVYMREYHAARYVDPENKQVHIERSRAWRQANREKRREHIRRRKKPVPWANKAAITEMRRQAKLAGLDTHHIVPIHGIDPTDRRRVSGLHVEYNLEIISATENKRRGRRVDLAYEAQRIMDNYYGLVPRESGVHHLGQMPRL